MIKGLHDIVRGVVNGASSVVRTELLGVERLTDHEVQIRLATCRRCPGGHVVLRSNGDPFSCGPLLRSRPEEKGSPCGCILYAKARDARETCPFGYWPSVGRTAQAMTSFVPSRQDQAEPLGQPPRRFLSRDLRALSVQACRSALIEEDAEHIVFANLRHPEPSAKPRPRRPRAVPPEEWLYDYFDRVVVISLARSGDRVRRLRMHLGRRGWPFLMPEVHRAVDGAAVGTPPWYKAGSGAWGCHQSHVQVIERAIMDGVKRLLVLEDDVFFVPDFSDRVESFLRALPPSWDQLYLGGQHLHQRSHPPRIVNRHALRAHNVNRTHAYALSYSGMRTAYKFLTDYAEHLKNPSYHIDHRLGLLHSSGSFKVLTPLNWLAGQAEGQSNINGRLESNRLWDSTRTVPPPARLVLVIAPHEEGASHLLLALSHLGVCFEKDPLRLQEIERIASQRWSNNDDPMEFDDHDSVRLKTMLEDVFQAASSRVELPGLFVADLPDIVKLLLHVCRDKVRLIVGRDNSEMRTQSLFTGGNGTISRGESQVLELRSGMPNAGMLLDVDLHSVSTNATDFIGRVSEFLGFDPSVDQIENAKASLSRASTMPPARN